MDRILFSPSQTKMPTMTWCRPRKESYEAPLRRHPLGANGWMLRILRGFPRPPWDEVASSLQHSFDRDLPLSPHRHKERNCSKQTAHSMQGVAADPWAVGKRLFQVQPSKSGAGPALPPGYLQTHSLPGKGLPLLSVPQETSGYCCPALLLPGNLGACPRVALD